MSTLAEGLPTRTVPLTVEEMGRDTIALIRVLGFDAVLERRDASNPHR